MFKYKCFHLTLVTYDFKDSKETQNNHLKKDFIRRFLLVK